MQTDVNETLAIASVPCQKWGQLYEDEAAFSTGTIFPALNKPFFVTEEEMDNSAKPAEMPKSNIPGQEDREQLMTRINQVSFFLNDLTLYLDTHCEDKEALQIFCEKGKEREALLTQFAQQHYPLTLDCVTKCDNAAAEYLWAKGPIPWEGACV